MRARAPASTSALVASSSVPSSARSDAPSEVTTCTYSCQSAKRYSTGTSATVDVAEARGADQRARSPPASPARTGPVPPVSAAPAARVRSAPGRTPSPRGCDSPEPRWRTRVGLLHGAHDASRAAPGLDPARACSRSGRRPHRRSRPGGRSAACPWNDAPHWRRRDVAPPRPSPARDRSRSRAPPGSRRASVTSPVPEARSSTTSVGCGRSAATSASVTGALTRRDELALGLPACCGGVPAPPDLVRRLYAATPLNWGRMSRP